jgi:hypothetical protein
VDGGANQEPVDLTAMMAQSRPGLARSAAHNREQRGWAQQVLRRLTVEVAPVPLLSEHCASVAGGHSHLAAGLCLTWHPGHGLAGSGPR